MEDPLTSSQSLRDSVCEYEKSQLKLDMENICLKQNDEQRILLCLDVLGLRVYKPIAIELPGTLVPWTLKKKPSTNGPMSLMTIYDMLLYAM